MKVLVTGGCGYIGSHTTVLLLEQGYDVVCIDNLSNSKETVIDRIFQITGKKISFYLGDVCDKDLLKAVFSKHKIDAVIHFAGYKAVGESVIEPIKYYRNNIDSTLSLLEVMHEYGCKKIIFSSSATVYGNPLSLPIKEDHRLAPTNPYGNTKKINEEILTDAAHADKDLGVVLLRYFNPIGAHESGLIGEDPNQKPNNLMPYILKVKDKVYPYLSVYGDDYDTIDGTGVRDYIHVVDLAQGHIKALEYLNNHSGIEAFNLGGGKGYSVLEIVKTFARVTNSEIPYKIVARRAGDIATCYASIDKASAILGFKATKTLEQMCLDSNRYLENSKKDL